MTPTDPQANETGEAGGTGGTGEGAETTLHLCTYFDEHFLVRALALHASLRRTTHDVVLWALCLTPLTLDLVTRLDLPGVRPVDLADLEAFDPELAACRHDRLDYEYYWTCSPCLPRYLLATRPEIDAIHYVDADLWFFASARLAVAEAGDAPLAITPHHYPPGRAGRLVRKAGRYNVGWLTFRRDERAERVLEWWRASCLEWCYDRLEPDRFGDQKYLDRFTTLEPATRVIEHVGVDAGPWSIRFFAVDGEPGAVTVAGVPLVAYHFSRLRRISADGYVNGAQRRPLSRTCRDLVYRPYLQELTRIERSLAARGIHATALGTAVPERRLRARTKDVLKSLVPGHVVRVGGPA